MIQKIYAVRDAKSEMFTNPTYKATPGVAEREFRMMVNDKESQLSAFPEDYALYELGEYDNLTGSIVSYDTPKHLVNALQCVQKDTQVPQSLKEA